MSYIYKITNLINNKIYVGYTSRSLERRFYEHKWNAYNNKNDSSYLHNAIKKYGEENFSIELIYEVDDEKEDWRYFEQKFIKELNSLTPNGYNILQGGDLPPIHYGEKNIKSKISNEELKTLYEMIKDNTIPYEEISKKFDLSISQLYSINQGKSRYNCLLNYPLRKYDIFEEKALQIIEILKTNIVLTNTEIADRFGIRPNEVASINNGKKYNYLYSGDYPIRKVTVPNDLKQKQEKANNIRKYIEEHEKNKLSWTQIGIQRELGYSRTEVEKTIKNIYPYCKIEDI